ncbi:MAG: molybdopterin converting factor subunit 1 [Proteobacteria bacterium]|nr:molybdopterin converting factor subunit 1 [Pseudomonadota bacterium]NOG60883.1 molybdopterin converting factor subunit 1 [Pseudomonadota bacterium]
MQVSVKYFASLRELMGEASSVIEIEEGTPISQLWQLIIENKNIEFENVMMAVNMEYVKSEHQLKSGDEVAFFPPVTGG